ncbi:BMC domain-containing protein [Moorella sulfitireducens]|uniref:BMC domain-containing protein n=1 Tax=Neomoorella sulfitireducens TaxID=2972948 RepID=UPI003BF54338
MVKTAAVDLLQATIMCPGKYIILVAGDISAVQSAVEAGKAGFAANIISSLVLANVHPDVFPALKGVAILAIDTNEELMVARQVAELIWVPK